jgi:hypothetical protein
VFKTGEKFTTHGKNEKIMIFEKYQDKKPLERLRSIYLFMVYLKMLSISHYVLSIVGLSVRNKLESVRKKATVTYFTAISAFAWRNSQ